VPYDPAWYIHIPYGFGPEAAPVPAPSSSPPFDVVGAIGRDFASFADSFASTTGSFETYLAPAGGGAGGGGGGGLGGGGDGGGGGGGGGAG
jgi:hypothetical protein